MKKHVIISLVAMVAFVFVANAQMGTTLHVAYAGPAQLVTNATEGTDYIISFEDGVKTEYIEFVAADLGFEMIPSFNQDMSFLLDARAGFGFLDTHGHSDPESLLGNVRDYSGIAYAGYAFGKSMVRVTLYPVGLGANYFSGTEYDGVYFTYSARAQLTLYIGRSMAAFAGGAYKLAFGKTETQSVRFPGFYGLMGLSFSF